MLLKSIGVLCSAVIFSFCFAPLITHTEAVVGGEITCKPALCAIETRLAQPIMTSNGLEISPITLGYCSCAILSETTIVTAAHCLIDVTDITELIVYYKSNTIFGILGGLPAKSINAKSIHTHEKYDPITYDYDVGYIVVDGKIQFESGVNSIDLSNPGLSPTDVETAGYGVIVKNAPLTSPISYAAKLKVVSNDICNQQYTAAGMPNPITPRMQCAYWTCKDSCQGDSGGPLLTFEAVKNAQTLIGTVSFGIGCGEPNISGVYTNLNHPEMRAFVQSAIDGRPTSPATLNSPCNGIVKEPGTSALVYYLYCLIKKGVSPFSPIGSPI